MRDRLAEAIKRSTADYTEIRLEKRKSTTVHYRGRNLETAGANTDTGGIVRCLVKSGGWGVSTFNRLDDLEKHVDFACECAKSLTREQIELAEVEPVVDDIKVNLEEDFREVPIARKKELVAGYNDILLSHSDAIRDTMCVYADRFVDYYCSNSEGTFIHEERPHILCRITAIARKNGNVQPAGESIGVQKGYEAVQGMDEIARTVAKRSVDLLEAETVKGGKYTVICNPNLAGVFIHEAFGHLSEADHVHENPKAREMMVLGREFGKPLLNVIDDGSVPGLRGSHKYDDEGVPTQKTYLVKEGKLVGRLHSRETAHKMNEDLTGNARAITYRFAPIVRMTNTAIEGGKTSFEDMISDIKLGVYACDSRGGQTMLENFTFTSGYAFMIRDGKVAEMVKDVVLGGNLFQTLANIDSVGNDFKWIETAGGCGKGGQMPLPVSMGSAHIRIQDVLMGGK
jgi:TldD protein